MQFDQLKGREFTILSAVPSKATHGPRPAGEQAD
jgi:hypothetical protein